MLTNNVLREKSFLKFLHDMEIDYAIKEVSSSENFFHFNLEEKNESEDFAKKLNYLVSSKSQVKKMTWADMIDEEIKNATCENEMYRESCKVILKMLNKVSFSQETATLEVLLPTAEFGALLKLVKYPNFKVSEDGKRLSLNMNDYVKNLSADVLVVEGINSTQDIYLKTSAVESKKIFYATKPIQENLVEVTPYLVMPNSSQPPAYHFVLDVSASMQPCIEQLKTSVIKLVEQLFQFQPSAKMSVTLFSRGTETLGTYDKESMVLLKKDISKIKPKSDTPLYGVTEQFLKLIQQSNQQNNVLLFTDGGNSTKDYSESLKKSALETLLKLMSPLQMARNKFYIFSYGIEQSNVMSLVAETFKSKVINTSNPEFLSAQNDMKEWAATRELFCSRMVIESKKGLKEEKKYSVAMDVSGQVMALEPQYCQDGDTLYTMITNGDGEEIINATQEISYEKKEALSILINKFGMNARKESSSNESTLGSEEFKIKEL